MRLSFSACPWIRPCASARSPIARVCCAPRRPMSRRAGGRRRSRSLPRGTPVSTCATRAQPVPVAAPDRRRRATHRRAGSVRIRRRRRADRLGAGRARHHPQAGVRSRAGLLRDGRLVPVLESAPPVPIQMACLYTHQQQQPKVRLFIDFMVERITAALNRTAAPGQLPR